MGEDYENLYDQVGQAPAEFPKKRQRAANQEVPNYYYRYGPTVPASPEYEQVQQYQYNQQQYAPYPVQPQQQYAPYQAPASRFYSNPYDIPQQASPYGNPYDADQYYVAPSYYYNQEQNQYRPNAVAGAPARSANP